jgi:phenylpropionate dioxygenase-like ring-hydroxylating dioxygenase large terminal subunit
MRYEAQVETLQTLLALHERQRDQDMLGQVVRLPVRNYTDPDILKREMETVFRGYPMVAGHVSSLRNTGDYLLSDWPRFPFVIVRNRVGELRAFLNTCRHRGARIVSGKEKCLKAFVCPFHGWAYDLNGKLKGVTKGFNFPDLDFSQFSLKELPVTERGGLVWIHPTPDARINLDAYLGPIGEDLDHFGLDDLVSYRKSRVIKHANWKLLIKTYLEGYHVPYLHRDTLSQSFRQGVIAHLEYGSHIRLAAARTNFLDVLKKDTRDWRVLDFASIYYSLFPNTFFIMHPDYVSINAFYPEAPDRTIWTHEMLYRASAFQGEQGQNALAKRFTYTNDTVFDLEDFAVAEDVQLGLADGANEFHTLGLEEGLLAIFQQTIDAALTRADSHP